MRRGDVVLVALVGDYGKPRPALIVQSDRLIEDGCPSIVVCPITSERTEIADFRVRIEPSAGNGLRKSSEVMVEKVAGVPRQRLRDVIGRVEVDEIRAVESALLLVLGFSR